MTLLRGIQLTGAICAAISLMLTLYFVAVACNKTHKTNTNYSATPLLETKQQLQAASQSIFTFDQNHKNYLSGAKLRALSLSLAFYNYQGAKKLIEELNAQIKLYQTRTAQF